MVYWRLRSTPELRDLSPAVRRGLVRRVRRMRTPAWMVSFTLLALTWGGCPGMVVLAMVAGEMHQELFALFVELTGSASLAWAGVSLAFVLEAVAVGAIVWPLWVLAQRREIRRYVDRTWRRGRPPICYACDYDLRGTPGEPVLSVAR